MRFPAAAAAPRPRALRSRAGTAVRRTALVLLAGASVVHAAAAQEQNGVHIGKEVTFDEAVIDIQWFGVNKSTLLLQTRRGAIHRSVDHGENWNQLIPVLEDLSKPPEGASGSIAKETATPTRIARLFVSRADRQVVMAQAATGKAAGFVSTDAGDNWRRIALEDRVQSWSWHDTRPEWALVSFWHEFCGNPTLEKPCTHDLYITKDYGRSFQLVMKRIVMFSWGSRVHKQEDFIYYTHFRDDRGNQRPLNKWMAGVDLSRTEDFGGKSTVLLQDGNKFQIADGYTLVVRIIDEASQTIALYVNSGGGLNFEAAILPHRLRPRGYSVLDTSEGAIILHVHHSQSTGDIYISDKKGLSFTMALPNNYRNRGLCAFEKVAGLEGIYIANIQEVTGEASTPSPVDEAPELPPAQGFEGASEGTQTEVNIRFRRRRLAEEDGGASEASVAAASADDVYAGDALFDDVAEGTALLARADHEVRQAWRGKGSRSRELLESLALSAGASPAALRRRLQDQDKIIHTVISFDKGGAWRNLNASSSNTGSALACSAPKCDLHLHGFTDLFDMFAPIYSYRNAMGIIMGSGNVGAQLSFEKSKTNTYLSRDGGLSWTEVRKGTYIYEYGNYGALVVMADMLEESAEVVYSVDEGTSWEPVSVGEKFSVHNVMIEPDATAKRFVMYGSRGDTGVFHHVDFSGLHANRTCVGHDNPEDKNSDYELWSPREFGSCLQGHLTKYVRRKPTAKCHNDENFERPSFKQNCKCTKENFECEAGFFRDIGSLECMPDLTASIHAHAPDSEQCRKNGHYLVPAYRRVPGDTCEGGFTPEQVRIPCVRGPHGALAAASARNQQGPSPFDSLKTQGEVEDIPDPPEEQRRNPFLAFFEDAGLLLVFAGCGFWLLQSDWVRKSGWYERLRWSRRAQRAGSNWAAGRSRVGAEMVGSRGGGYAPPPTLSV